MARFKKVPRRQRASKSRALQCINVDKQTSENPSENDSAGYRGDESCRIANVMARLGAEHHAIAAALGTNIRSFQEWRKAYPEFSEALNIGIDVSESVIERSLLKRALGYSYPIEKLFHRRGEVVRAQTIEHVPPDVKAAHTWLRSRMPDVYGQQKGMENERDVAFLRRLTEHNNRAIRNEEGENVTEYRGEESCRIGKAMALLGASDCEISAALGITISTLKVAPHTP